MAKKKESKSADSKKKGKAKKSTTKTEIKTKVELPELKDVLKAGLQFGHETKRWSPRMEPYIYGEKNNIHIIDVSKTLPLMKKAGDFMAQAIMKGPVLFLGTKRQASGIVREAAIESGAHFVDERWAGGLLTNFDQIKDSLNKLNELESSFEEGITNRTKYEISIMKKDWDRLNRLYGGIKQLPKLPSAVFVVDPDFEAGPVRECNYLNIPVIAMVDTNTDPRYVDYPIPANDDAIGSIELVVSYMKDRIMEMSKSAFRIKHNFKDYSDLEVKIKKVEEETETKEPVKKTKKVVKAKRKPKKSAKKKSKKAKKAKKKGKTKKVKKTKSAKKTDKGILGKYQEKKEK